MTTNEPAGIDLDNEHIEKIWNSLDGKQIIAGENQLNWNAALRREFAKAIARDVLARRAPAPVVAHDAPEARASKPVQIMTAGNDDRAITQDWMAYCAILRQAGKEPTDAQGDAFEFAWNAARASQPEGATGTTGAVELSDAGIVEVLASMGVDSEPSKFGFKELQVRTTVPTIRKVVERYLAAPASAQPDRGAAQFDHAKFMQMVREFAEVCYGVRRSTEDVGKNLIDYVKSLAAPSPASQPVAPDLLDALQKAARLLRAAGFAMTGTATSQIVAAIEAHAQQEAAPAGWNSISTLEESDDLIWLRRGDSIEGPRVMDPYDFDRFSEWAPCEPPCDIRGAGQFAVPNHAPAAAAPSDAKDAAVPDHSEREAANADVLLAALRQAERAFGNYDRHLDDVNAMAAIRAALASAGEVCKHRRQTTTALGAATGSGWTCKDCGELLSYTQAPDQSPATIAAGQEAANAKDAALQFANDVIDHAFDGGDLDGGTVQEMAEARGLLKHETVAEPCGGACNCMEAGADFPTTCYRKTYMKAQRAAMAAAPSSEKGGDTCTCPSGDGSLRWPCPAHPPSSAAGKEGGDRG